MKRSICYIFCQVFRKFGDAERENEQVINNDDVDYISDEDTESDV